MNENKKELLINYIKANISPILTDYIDIIKLPNSIILPANCNENELCAKYIGAKYTPPKWMIEILKTNEPSILVIDKIDSITKEEQSKFIEILKYKKVSTFKLPESTIIIVTAKEINENTINEKIYSLLAHIEG